MYYVGCDQHKHYSQIAVKDETGQMIEQQKLYHHDRDALKAYFDKLPSDSLIALEASGFQPWLCDLLSELELKFKLVHPRKTRAIAEEKIKTDKLSASVLADLLRANLVYEAFYAPTQMRQFRYWSRYRQSLVHLKTNAKNKIHSILDQLGVQPPTLTDLFGKAGRNYLTSLEIPDVYQKAIQGYLKLIDTLQELITSVEGKYRCFAKENPAIELLKSLPGVGPILAHMILAEIGDIKRFWSSSKLSGYAGMVPSLHQSGQQYYSGPITKQGNKYLRWAFVEAAQRAIHQDVYLAKFYAKIYHKKGRPTAIVAVAHKLLIYTYWILKEQKSYKAQRPVGDPVDYTGPLAAV